MMLIKLINLLFSASLLLLYTKAEGPMPTNEPYRNYYCQLETCSNPERHVLCLYPDSSTSTKCRYALRFGLSTQQKRAVLSAHVIIKKAYGSGKNITFPTITWDGNLEKMAQAWARQCSLFKDECRSLDNSYVVKQNVGHYVVRDYYPYFSKGIIFDFTKPVKDWSHIPFNPANPAVFRYRDVNRIGCGLIIRSECDQRNYYVSRGAGVCPNSYHIHIVCNYSVSNVSKNLRSQK